MLEQICELYNSGKNLREISIITNTNESTIYYNLKKNGILMRKPGPKPKIDKK